MKTRGRYKEAAKLCGRLLRFWPADPANWFNYAWLNYQIGKIAAVESSVRSALALDPAHADAANCLGIILQDLAIMPAALNWFRRAHIVAPQLFAGGINYLFGHLYDERTSLPEILLRSKIWAGEQIRSYPQSPLLIRQETEADRLPTIGFVSGDFADHAVGNLVIPAMEELARRGYRITCYTNSERIDEVTHRFKRVASQWRSLVGVSDDKARQLVKDDQIDILFDLSGYSAGTRIMLFAGRAAPLQIAWVGYPATTGFPGIDYLLADKVQVPKPFSEFYSERIIRLPHAYILFQPPSNALPPGPPPTLRRGYVTFGSFNMSKKIGSSVIETWCRILNALPNSRLLLKTISFSDPFVRDFYRQQFATHGIASRRLVLLGPTTAIHHRAMMALTDIALDSFPYSGGLTTLESLWMGLPVVTLEGKTMAGRHSTAYLASVGLNDLVSANKDDYVACALRLAKDREGLTKLRAGMRNRLINSPLCDNRMFGDHLDVALRTVWRRHCMGMEPADLSITPGKQPLFDDDVSFPGQ
jgi:predicted O-linked N-acetylglucosamine transferase (SPINDLY family)